MKTILQETCQTCQGRAFVFDDRRGSIQCPSCHGSGWRHVPRGYTQSEIEEVRALVDSMAIRIEQC